MDLLLYCENGDLSKIENLFRRSYWLSVNGTGISSKTNPLYVAYNANQHHVVKYLILRGAKIMVGSYDELCLLKKIILDHEFILFDFILSKHPEIRDITMRGGRTPMHWAFESLSVPAFDYLLSRGFTINLESSKGRSGIVTIDKTNQKLSRYLRFPFPTSPNNLLHFACLSDNSLALFDRLLEIGYKVDPFCLILAIKNNALGLVEKIVKAGLSPNSDLSQDYHKGTSYFALNVAVQKNHVQMVKLLFSLGADPNVLDKTSGRNALHILLYSIPKSSTETPSEVLEIALDLISSGVCIDAKDKFGWTSLMIAAKHNLPDLILFLLSSGANANIPSPVGLYLIHYIALNMSPESETTVEILILKLLLSKQTKTVSISSPSISCSKRLRSYLRKNLFHAATSKYEQKLKYLYMSKSRIYPIHLAILKENSKMVQTLINLDCDGILSPTATQSESDHNNTVISPLDMAHEFNNEEITNILLKNNFSS